MILGTGTDITDARRIEKAVARFGQRFLDRFLTGNEQKYLARYTDGMARTMAFTRRFAAKEAAAKALRTGFRGGITMRDIEIAHDDMGAPGLLFHGKALERLKTMTAHPVNIHLSLSDEPPYALAFVIIESVMPEIR